ncbi:MAG: tetratricopeptide repeat protein [Gammaproteobacteria bacterium]|nr:tetratricopeptide repeat protein [Gammaproteobacteria bacterium]MBU1655665.1 tetratricopeptide repeat protein [Gammaproteobacteria bacterium]MBU1960318.1 tetratricopeptide repeat protein [Gammaproteobacteria bacterium]
MNAYESEEQQVEALKDWWRENGKSVLFGAVLGIAIVFGWQAWRSHVAKVGAAASQVLAEMSEAARENGSERARTLGQRILDEYGDTVYADFAALSLARLAVEAKDPAAAQKQLQRVIDHHSDPGLADLARMRLARLLLDQGKGGEASKLLDQVTALAHGGEVSVLRGDIALAAGDKAAAREAWRRALNSGLLDDELVRLKLDDLGSEGKPE